MPSNLRLYLSENRGNRGEKRTLLNNSDASCGKRVAAGQNIQRVEKQKLPSLKKEGCGIGRGVVGSVDDLRYWWKTGYRVAGKDTLENKKGRQLNHNDMPIPRPKCPTGSLFLLVFSTPFQAANRLQLCPILLEYRSEDCFRN